MRLPILSRFKYNVYRTWLLHTHLPVTGLSGKPGKDNLPVVICLWREERFRRISEIIEQLDNQKIDNQKIDLYFWNNNFKKRHVIKSVIENSRNCKSVNSINIYNSPLNIGGVGRFYMLRHLRRKFNCKFGVMIDDDQNVKKAFLAKLYAKAGPCVYASIWAYKIKAGYWDRLPLKDGQAADYCGTGGSIIDCSIFEDTAVFTKLPYRFLFVEDLWLSWYVIKNKKGKLLKVDARVEFVGDDTDQYHQLADTKKKFYEYLINRYPLNKAGTIV